MEHVEDMINPEIVETETPRRRARDVERSAVIGLSNPLVRLLGLLQLVAVVACCVLLYGQWQARQAFLAQADRAAALESKTEALAVEMEKLRHFVASKTSEDVIHLKMSILKPDLDPKLSSNIAKLIHRYAGIHHQDVDLILAIMYIESQFDPGAVSNKGAMGLMQVMPQWQKVLGMPGDLADPETSIKYGLQILGFYQEMYKDLDMALTAYNRGPGPVDMALMKGKTYKNGYAAKVMGVYQRLKAMTVAQI